MIPRRAVRRLVVALVCAHRRSADAEALADLLWPDARPARWEASLHANVSRLRAFVGSGSVRRAGDAYELTLTPDGLDADQFEVHVRAGAAAIARGDCHHAVRELERATCMWRGRALGEFADEPFALVEAQRLDQLCIDADEMLAVARFRCGEFTSAISGLDLLVERHPLRERNWALLASAYFLVGRQADALSAISRARGHLRNELGVNPGRELVEVERAVLDHDAAILRRGVVGTASDGGGSMPVVTSASRS